MIIKAHRVDELVAAGPFKRAWLYKQISSGALPARRIDGVVFVLASDWNAFLTNAPAVRSSNPITESPIGDVMRSFDTTVAGINAAGKAAVATLGAKLAG